MKLQEERKKLQELSTRLFQGGGRWADGLYGGDEGGTAWAGGSEHFVVLSNQISTTTPIKRAQAADCQDESWSRRQGGSRPSKWSAFVNL